MLSIKKLLTKILNKIDDINSKKILFVKSYSYGYSISANSNLGVTANDLKISKPANTTGIAFRAIATGNGNVVWRALDADATGSNNVVMLRNLTNSTVTSTLDVRIIYVLNENYQFIS